MSNIAWSESDERARRFLVERARDRALVPFVGAGVSVEAGLLSWPNLIAPLAETMGLNQGDVDLLDIAQYFADLHGRPKLLQHVRTALGKAVAPGCFHLALARMPSQIIFTTNYDQLMEQAIVDVQGMPPDVIVVDSHVGLIDETRRTTLIKMHGCLSLPETIVLARDDYEAYAHEHPATIAYLQSLLATRTFLFVGFSMTDYNFRMIHAAIRHALGRNRRQAYLLTSGHVSEHLARYWSERGVTMLRFETFAVARNYLERIAEESSGDRSVLAVARTLSKPAPSLSIEGSRLVESAQALEKVLQDVVAKAVSEGLLDPDSSAQTDPVAPVDPIVVDALGLRREKLRALLDLAESVSRLIPLSDPNVWVTLGDMLYAVSDSSGAIQAYNQAVKSYADQRRQGAAILARIRGNLARAYSHEGHYSRAEWLLRQCVFRPGFESPEDTFDRSSVFDRLNFDHLTKRPTDASELASALSRRAELLREGGHLSEAFSVLREARYLLEPVLGVSKDPKLDRDVFKGSYAERPVRRQWERGAISSPVAYAFNFLGKCYRLSCSLALDQHRSASEIEYYSERAVRYCRRASKADPNLPYPWAHRLLLQADTRLPRHDRQILLADLEQDLRKAIQAGADAMLIRSLLQQVGMSAEARHVLEGINGG